MRLIRKIEVKNFRSLRNVLVEGVEPYTPFVGLNGSGKSNLLRALNLFFTGSEIEPGVPMVLKRDHFDPGRPLGGRRRISVRITFDLSAGYEPRPNVNAFLTKIGATQQLVVERAWVYADPSGLETDQELLAGLDDASVAACPTEDVAAVGTFIRSIRFRFVPNHVEPARVLDREIQTLRRAINRRVRTRAAFRAGGVEDALSELGAVTTELFEGLSTSVVEYTPELSAVSAQIPEDFADLAFQLGLSPVSSEGTLQGTELQGSGTQSFLLLHVLDLVDQSAFEVDFGWTKAVIWAFEEPESFLHAGLRTKYASDLASFSSGKRRQLFTTTHETEFQRVGPYLWLVRREGAATTVRRLTARDGIRESSRLRVSSFEHPLFLSADRPLVLVEGPSDVEYLRRAIEERGLRPQWVLSSVPILDPTQDGGDATIAYLRANSAVLMSRPLHAPVIVVRDWSDSPSKIAQLQSAVAPHETSTCIKTPETLCNPELGQKFRGIERYLLTDLVENVLSAVLRGASLTSRFPLHIEKVDLDAGKPALLEAFRTAPTCGEYLTNLAGWIDEEVRGVVGTAPSGPMLLPI